MGARIAIHTKSIPFVLHRPGTAATARHRLRATLLSLSLSLSLFLSFTLSKLCSQFTSDQVSALRFYANPMPMSCRRRGKPLSLYARQGPKGISFSAVRAIPFPAGLFQGNHFPFTLRLGTPASSIVAVFLCALLSFRSSRSYPVLSLFSFPLLSSPLLSTTILSLVTQP